MNSGINQIIAKAIIAERRGEADQHRLAQRARTEGPSPRQRGDRVAFASRVELVPGLRDYPYTAR